jgi:DNA-binding response OmpR family regulator
MSAADTEPRHLLVVDDDNRIRDLLKEYLARKGFRVSTAADAAGARRLLGALCFDLLIVDVMMPGEDGLSLTKWLRGRPGEAGAAPVLILTARGQPDDRIEGLRLGADDYLAKPFDPEELVLRVEAILRRVRSSSAAASSTPPAASSTSTAAPSGSPKARRICFACWRGLRTPRSTASTWWAPIRTPAAGRWISRSRGCGARSKPTRQTRAIYEPFAAGATC